VAKKQEELRGANLRLAALQIKPIKANLASHFKTKELKLM